MGFVKTAAEVAEIQQYFQHPRWMVTRTQVEFETSHEFVRTVLPPCLDPPESPTGVVSIGRWQSHCCGEFDTASTFIKARTATTRASTR